MPNRAPSQLVWNPPAAGARGLTRAALVTTAVALADREGLEAVSIRRVAGELGVRPMSLYTHIASKDDLLDLMVNEVIGEAVVPEPLPEHWRDAVREIAIRSHAAFVAHPWTLEAFSRQPRFGPHALRHVEQSLAAVEGLGLDEETAATLLAVVDEYAMGNAMRTVIGPDEGELRRLLNETLEAAPDPGAFPRLAAAGAGRTRADAFEVGLDALLEGLERTLVHPR